jgi:class 3 adenylate cyclase/predicted ATPase
MQQVADWLGELGLAQYAQRFAENDISFVILPDLSDQDLEKIGVASLGHRRLLLRAIAELKIVDKGTTTAATTASAPAASPKIDTAERRQVTVIFSDLVGSTALSARMDPEDLREVISGYQNCVADTVQRFGGFVAKYMGDGVLIYFGYPQAHEDDAERAVRAGLELVAAVGGLKTHAPLQTRVGIATGLVVVGDLIGSGASQEQAIVGETPNVAARLQGVAEPNSVVIAESTRRLVGNLFQLDDLGPQDLKGIAESVRAWAALRSSSVESRFEALHASGLTELVGREEELELLLRRWSKAKNGEGQVVLLSGEAGIGKSRLTAALMERLANEPHARLRYFCSPQHTDSALHPIISQMERAAGFAHDDAAQAKLDKLDALLTESFTPRQGAALLAEMLSLPNDGRYPALELTPQQRRQKTLEALTAHLEALSHQKPVLMIFEDAHWADPTSLETFGRAVDRIRTLGVLLIVTYRPEFEPPWIGRPDVAAVILNRLGECEIGAIIDSVTGNKMLSANIRQDIIERTDGIPLFVEEMTKAVLEAETEGEGQQAAARVSPRAQAVPASLHASLMARLDRLGPAKEVAQIGAAIGREFSHLLLDAVVRKSPAELQSALDRLVDAGLLFRQGLPPHATYLFKHALVQDAAHGTLLRDPRRGLHARIADTIENQFAEIAENQPEVLARHCTEAGMLDKAARLWGQAGQRSLDRSALLEAVELLSRAVTLIASLPATPALRREEIRLQIALVTPLMQVKGHAAPETKAAAERARRLIEEAQARAEPLEDPLLLFSVLYSFWVAAHGAFNGDMMRALAAQFLELAEKQDATIPLVVGHRIMGSSLMLTGDIAEGRRHYEQAITLYDPAAPHSLETRFGQDLSIALLSYRSSSLWLLGYPQAARTDNENSVAKARETGHATTLILALTYMSVIDVVARKDYADAAKTTNDELIALSEEKGALFWKTHGEFLRGSLLAQAGSALEGVQAMSSSLTTIRATGTKMFLPYFLMLLSEAHADLGEFDAARGCINEALIAIQTNKERWCEAEVNRVAGEVALQSPVTDAGKAEAYFEHALAIARQQRAKSWELRASMSLARLWRGQGKRVEARRLLAPVYGWFTEGFDTRDLKEAKALLEELAA